MKDIQISLTIDDGQAWALAQFLKRTGWSEIRQNAQDDDEAYVMREGIEALQKALAESGFEPR